MDSPFCSGLLNWCGDELFSVPKPSEPLYDHLHTLMFADNIGSICELKVFDYVLSQSFNKHAELKPTEIMSPMTHLLARLELDCDYGTRVIGIYSRDAVLAVCSRFVRAYNMIVKNEKLGRNKWRNVPLERYMIMFKGNAESLVRLFVCYLLENAQGCEEWGRFSINTDFAEKCMKYPVKYMLYLISATRLVKKFIQHCVGNEVELRKLFMINIPTFMCKNKYKAALYFDSNEKFIPRFLERLEMYAYGCALGEDNLDLYWTDASLIDELFENSNKEGRKALLKYFKINN
jgi:hypothetical protein